MRGAKTWRLLGTVTAVLLVIGGGSQTWAMVVQQRSVAERPYDVSIRKLKLDTGNASVRVRPGREGRVVVRQQLDWTIRKPVVSAVFEGDELTLGLQCRLVLPFVDLGCGAQIELEVPAGTDVSGQFGSGSVDVEGLSGNVRLEGTSGAAQLSGLSGEVYAHLTSGLVKGEDLSSARVDAATTSGAVELAFTRAPHAVDVSTTSGSVTMTVPKGGRYAFSGEAGSGSRHIDPELADGSSPNSIRAEVISGSLRIDAATG
ncbi:DUF4097 family beta strand repeat-containing protein [Kitasatospora sp. NPDC097643]|uniref:DUF4097 family beta strand repeat-containing protein n=1 Tax=Kitasatospora sp. NPDC097643 TaxID=3157230 RepID=UPI00332E1C71